MKDIFILASYPKSGNTWLRLFLQALSTADKALDINKLAIPNIASRSLFEMHTGLDSHDLLPEELQRVRQHLLASIRQSESTQQAPLIFKTHECLGGRHNINNLFNAAVKGAIYLVRNPLDVAVSFAHHNHVSIDRAIEQMNTSGFCVAQNQKSYESQFPQEYGSWSENVKSWVYTTRFPVLVLSYELLLSNSQEQFSRLVEFLGLNYSQQDISEALTQCRFDKLQQQEKDSGFRERSHAQQQFFRHGKANTWQDVLSNKQIETLCAHHEEMLLRFAYHQTNKPQGVLGCE